MSVIKRMLSGFVPAAIICTVPAMLIWCDTAILGLDCQETGVVEISQSICLLTIIVLISILAIRCCDMRGGLILATGFFATMLIREQDGILDHIVHGSWLYPALIVTAIAVLLAWRNHTSILPAFLHMRNNHHFPALSLGLFLLLGFSRVFGNKSIWKTVCDLENFRAAKHVAEEGTELMAYAILLYWAITYFTDLIKSPPASRG